MKKTVLLYILLIAPPLHAQAKMDDILSLSLKELMQVKITGSTLTPKSLNTVPAAITVFTHQDIRRLGMDTLDELMNIVPGFQSYRNGGSSLFYPYSLRGRRISGEVPVILILVDGQRIDAPFSSGSAVIMPKYPLMHIDRVEFIRGPGSAVYGSNAMMGVINIITRSMINEVSVGYGNFNRRQTYIHASPKAGTMAVDLFGHIDVDDGDEYSVQDTFSPNIIDVKDPREIVNLSFKLKWLNTRLNLQHYQFELKDFYESQMLSNDGFNERKSQYSAISLKQDIHWHKTKSYIWASYHLTKTDVTAQISPAGAFSAISDPPSNAPMIGGGDVKYPSESRFQLHNDWEINKRSDLQFGIEYRHIDMPEVFYKINYDLNDLNNGIIPIRYYGSLVATTRLQVDSKRNIIGLYAQYQRELFSSTNLTIGLRHDNFSGIGSRLSPRFAFVQGLGNHHNLKLLYAEAFRAPAENELNLANNDLFIGNPDLEPEVVKTLEIFEE